MLRPGAGGRWIRHKRHSLIERIDTRCRIALAEQFRIASPESNQMSNLSALNFDLIEGEWRCDCKQGNLTGNWFLQKKLS
jgi:hypothetical protein